MIKIGYLENNKLVLPHKPPKGYLYITKILNKHYTSDNLSEIKSYIFNSINSNISNIKCGIINVSNIDYKKPNVIWLLEINDFKEKLINNVGWLLEDGRMVVPNMIDRALKKYIKPPTYITLPSRK